MKKIISVFLFALAVYSLTAQMDEKFYHPDKEWIGIDSLKYQEIIFCADNDTVHSVIVYPNGDPKATIIFFHGNGGNISKWTNYIKPLIHNGFQVCMLDYRGYGKSTGKPTHLNIAHDSQVLFDTLIRREDVKNTRLIIYGASIGSQVAVHLTKNNHEKISALILDGMMASFTDVALLSTPVEYHEQVRQFVTSPYSAKEEIKEIKNIPMLFIHSREDPIPIKGAQEVYDSVSSPKTFWIYEGNHVEAPIKYPQAFLEYVNKLL